MSQRSEWTDRVSRQMVHQAATHAPDALSGRLEEEWLADWADRPSGGSRLRFALGCCWATCVIAHEHRTVSLPLASAPSGLLNLGQVTRRSTTLILVLTLHGALFYLLLAKLSQTHFTASPPPFSVAMLKLPPSQPMLPSIPGPIYRHVALDVDPPELPPVETADPGPYKTIVDRREPFTSTPLVSPPSPPLHVVQRIPGGPGIGFPNAEQFYPDAAKRLGEQGGATVQVCVDSKGRLTADPTVVQSAGSARLDEGALKLTRAASGHYRPASEDGRLVNSCYALKIRFELRN